MSIDVLFVSPGNARAIYQDLSRDFSAIEPPTWALLLAESVRAIGFVPEILDVNAEQLSLNDAVERIRKSSPRLICFVVYGQNPNSGTVNMGGAVALAKACKESGLSIPVAAVGSHLSALPREVLRTEPAIDVVFCNEGVYALRNLLASDLTNPDSWSDIKGIGFRQDEQVVLTPPERVVSQEDMDVDLPGYAWDLLPHRSQPLDLYRSHFWHAGYDHAKRTPFAAIYTSLGCTFRCNFCMINILNRDDNEDIGVAGNYAKMRFWSPEFVVREIGKLVDMGVSTLRISDEMFLLNRKYFVPLCEMLNEQGYGKKLNMWAYSRIDTVRDPAHLDLIKRAGINNTLTYGVVLTGGGSQLRNIIPLAKELLNMPIRLGKPTINIEGNKDFADNPVHSTLLGLLLWPFHSNEQKTSELNPTSWIEYIKKVLQKIF